MEGDKFLEIECIVAAILAASRSGGDATFGAPEVAHYREILQSIRQWGGPLMNDIPRAQGR
jgi:hypothetical protein